MLATLTNVLVFATEAGGEEEGGSFLVSPGIGLMVWTLVLFGVSMFILSKVAFPRIAEALDKRQKAIEDSIDTAERTRKEADELLAEYRERLTAARQQADDIVARARKAGEQAEADLVVKGKERREELLEQARTRHRGRDPPRDPGDPRRGRRPDDPRDREGHPQDADRRRPAPPGRGGRGRAGLRRALGRARSASAMEEIAVVYARSLFEAALEQDKLDVVREQLGEFADALDGDHELQVFFFSPTSRRRRRRTGCTRR